MAILLFGIFLIIPHAIGMVRFERAVMRYKRLAKLQHADITHEAQSEVFRVGNTPINFFWFLKSPATARDPFPFADHKIEIGDSRGVPSY